MVDTGEITWTWYMVITGGFVDKFGGTVNRS